MDSIDILHTVNSVATATSSLRFCNTRSLLDRAHKAIKADLSTIFPYVAPALHQLLSQELRIAYASQLAKVTGAK